ncbi:MAG: pyrroloquinoline quinone biosynthesis protein PqqD [Candidatus Angelobacter sp.]|jgi:pyrroloquinoline quinone biosynthesis protein D|nr:pyrroloquinoline quinone biosynthesis protein PqqD [Candidatus Angelobacter sp.]
MMIPDTSQPRLARGCRFSSENMLLVPEGVLRLKGTGAEILKLCDGTRTVAGIVAIMRDQYDGSVKSDVEDFLQKLKERGVVEW